MPHQLLGVMCKVETVTVNIFMEDQSSHCFFLIFYLFMAVLGLRCCTRAFSSCSERGILFVAVHGLLIAVASLVEEHTGSRLTGFSSCGTWAQ